MEVKLIKTEEEYQAALARVEGLMDAEPGSEQEEELVISAMVVEYYEKEHYSMTPQVMSRSDQLIQSALSLVHTAIEIAKPEIFIEPDSERDLDVLGILVSKYTEWDCADILRVAFQALEDANFHEWAEKIADMYTELTGLNPWE